jgi:hypothetical protein
MAAEDRLVAKGLSEVAEGVRANVSSGMGMTNASLEKLCRASCSANFRGVYAADYLPPSLAPQASFILIVNLGTRRGLTRKLPVGHFVTVVALPSAVLYIDSFGLPSAQPHVDRFLQQCRREVCFNLRQVQDFDSSNCGLYSMLFACYYDRRMTRGEEPPVRLAFRDKNLRQNDELCARYLQEIMQTH